MEKKLRTLLEFLLITSSTLALETGNYRISSLYDGSFLENRFGMELTDFDKNIVITNDLKCGANKQLWNIINATEGCFDCPPQSYGILLLNQNIYNEISVSKSRNSDDFQYHIFEIIPAGKISNDIFNIRSKEYNKCLLNWGTGNRIGWWPKCESFSTNQLWKFHRVDA